MESIHTMTLYDKLSKLQSDPTIMDGSWWYMIKWKKTYYDMITFLLSWRELRWHKWTERKVRELWVWNLGWWLLWADVGEAGIWGKETPLVVAYLQGPGLFWVMSLEVLITLLKITKESGPYMNQWWMCVLN